MKTSMRRNYALAMGLAIIGLMNPSQAWSQDLELPGGVAAPSAMLNPPPTASFVEGAITENLPVEGSSGFVAPQTLQNSVGAAPGGSYSGSGVGYSSSLGSHLRARYNSESYGQLDGNFDLGTMKMWQPTKDSAWFIDGQVTLNDESKVGYNLGVGYRWMTLPVFPWSPDRQKIAGLSLWSDGSSAGGENFFPQVGLSAELLGDRWDFRSNLYIPVGPTSQTRDFRPTGNNIFFGNFLGAETVGVRDTALTGGEVEVARRIRDLDAWAFLGAYAFDGGGFDTAGGRYGLRGYATPDVLLQVQLTHDELFDTNAVFSGTWFIGRTRNNTCLTCTLRDRFREPVIRNDYVAMVQSEARGNAGAFTDANGDPLQFFHVNSASGAGGDGTAENPGNMLSDITTKSVAGQTIIAHAGSNFSGSTATLKDNQIFFGEGGGRNLSVTTSELGAINIPATNPGADSINGVVPILNGVAGQPTVTLADNNTVQNLTFNGGSEAIKNGATGSLNPTLTNLTINNTTVDGIALAAFDRPDTDDTDGDGNTTETTSAMGNVTINQVTFNGVQGNDIDINAASTANTITGEVLNINNVTSNNNITAQSIRIRNTNSNTGGTDTINNFTYNGGTTGKGAIVLTDTASTISVQNSMLTGGTEPAVDIQNSKTPNSITVGATTTIKDVAGNAVRIQGNAGAVTVDADITTATTVTGGGVLIGNNTGVVNVNGDVTSNNFDTVRIDGARAAVNFGASGSITHNGTLGDAVTVIDTADLPADTGNITFNGDITNASGRAFNIVDGGDDVTVTGDVTDSGTGIRVVDRDSGATTLFAGQTTLNTTVNDAVTLDNNHADSSVDFTNLDITTTTGDGFVSNGDGEINVTGTGSTITTDTGQAININGGSSTNGVTFANVTTGTVGSDPVSVQDFDGTVTINDGDISSAARAVFVSDASLAMMGVNLNATGATVVQAAFTGATARSLSLDTVTLDNKDVVVAGSGTGNNTVTMNSVTEAGDVSLSTAAGLGSLTTTMTNVTSTTNGNVTLTTQTGAGNLSMNTVTGVGNVDLNANGSGALNTTMNTVTSTSAGNVTLDVTSTGAGTLSMNTVNTAGTVTANSSGGSSGALTVNSTNSGGTTPLGAISMNDLGNGAASLSLLNTTSSAGATFDSAGNGSATYSVVGGSYGGPLDAAATNAGSFSATVDGPTTLTNGRIIFDGGNAGTLTYVVRDMNFSTGADVTGVDLRVGTNVTTGNVTVQSNTVSTNNGVALNLDTNGGDVNYLITGNTLTNNSATLRTALLDHSGVSISDTTVTSNTFVNTNAGSPVEFELVASTGSPDVNLNFSSNIAQDGGGGAGSGEFFINEDAGTIDIFERAATFNNTGTRNNGTVTFDPNVETDYGDLPSAPQTP